MLCIITRNATNAKEHNIISIFNIFQQNIEENIVIIEISNTDAVIICVIIFKIIDFIIIWI